MERLFLSESAFFRYQRAIFRYLAGNRKDFVADGRRPGWLAAWRKVRTSWSRCHIIFIPPSAYPPGSVRNPFHFAAEGAGAMRNKYHLPGAETRHTTARSGYYLL